MKEVGLRSKRGFPKTLTHEGRVWHKVRNENHKEELVLTNNYVFASCNDDSFRGGFSFHLYYTPWYFEPTQTDIKIMNELNEMLEYFLSKE